MFMRYVVYRQLVNSIFAGTHYKGLMLWQNYQI